MKHEPQTMHFISTSCWKFPLSLPFLLIHSLIHVVTEFWSFTFFLFYIPIPGACLWLQTTPFQTDSVRVTSTRVCLGFSWQSLHVKQVPIRHLKEAMGHYVIRPMTLIIKHKANSLLGGILHFKSGHLVPHCWNLFYTSLRIEKIQDGQALHDLNP